MSFPAPGAKYTLNAYDYKDGMTMTGDSPGSSVTASYIPPSGKGSGPSTEQIWTTQPTGYENYFFIINPTSNLYLTNDDGIVADVMASPKDYNKLQKQYWRPEPDSSSPGKYLFRTYSGDNVITMPHGVSNIQLVVTAEAPDGDDSRQYQLWAPQQQ